MHEAGVRQVEMPDGPRFVSVGASMGGSVACVPARSRGVRGGRGTRIALGDKRPVGAEAQALGRRSRVHFAFGELAGHGRFLARNGLRRRSRLGAVLRGVGRAIPPLDGP